MLSVVDKCHYLPRQSLAGEWTSVSTSPAKFGGGGIVNLLNFGADDDEKRLLGLRQAGSRRQKQMERVVGVLRGGCAQRFVTQMTPKGRNQGYVKSTHKFLQKH